MSTLPFWGDTLGGHPLMLPSYAQSKVDGADPNWEAPALQWTAWDTAHIGGLKVPGLVKVRARRRRRRQTSRTPGASGATLKSLGFDPAEIDFEVTMWTAQHLDLFAALVAEIQKRALNAMKSKNTKSELAIPVEHPGLALYRIYSLYWLEGTIPESRGGQVFSATLRFTEFYPITSGTQPAVAYADGAFASTPSVPVSSPSTTPPSQNPKASAP